VIVRAEGVIVAARYRLVRELGVGGMGSVWLAHDLLLDSPCALKLIDDDKARSEEVRIRFAREAKLAAQLRGAHVVDVFEHGEWDETPFIAMEFLEGEDLATRLERRGQLEPRETYRFVAHVARALARAHAYGIVHRDLKPENIFLVPGDDGEVAKVLDFGIAKHDAYSLRDKATKTGSLLGTPYYMSPEQARGKEIDHRSDLWSLGVIAFQCLTGAPPFESEALGELMGLILYEELPKVSERNAELPAKLEEWWARAAARDRDARYGSAKELADSLGGALDIEPLLSVPTVFPMRASFPELDRLATPLPLTRQKLSSHPGSNTPSGERKTDAPLSHTRHSDDPEFSTFKAALSNPPGARFFRKLQSARRRQLVGGAIVLGVGAGIGLTVLVTRPEPSQAPLPAVAAPVPSTALDKTPVVLPGPSLPVTAPSASASAAAPSGPADESAETEESESDKSKASSSKSSRHSTPKPASTKSGRRDYGI